MEATQCLFVMKFKTYNDIYEPRDLINLRVENVLRVNLLAVHLGRCSLHIRYIVTHT